MSYLTITHLINEIYQVVCDERDTVLFQGTKEECEAFLSQLHS